MTQGRNKFIKATVPMQETLNYNNTDHILGTQKKTGA